MKTYLFRNLAMGAARLPLYAAGAGLVTWVFFKLITHGWLPGAI